QRKLDFVAGMGFDWNLEVPSKSGRAARDHAERLACFFNFVLWFEAVSQRFLVNGIERLIVDAAFDGAEPLEITNGQDDRGWKWSLLLCRAFVSAGSEEGDKDEQLQRTCHACSSSVANCRDPGSRSLPEYTLRLHLFRRNFG